MAPVTMFGSILVVLAGLILVGYARHEITLAEAIAGWIILLMLAVMVYVAAMVRY